MTAKSLPAYALNYPPDIRFGWGCRRELPALLHGLADATGKPPRLLLVTSGALARAGFLEELISLCGGPSRLCHHDGIPHDPPLAAVAGLVAAARDFGATAVVAAGGGSVIDAAKVAAVLVPAAAPALDDCFHGGAEITRPGLPLAALPTTAGSGAEITRNAVLTDRPGGLKKSLRSPFMIPRAALVDPELTMGMPPALTAAGGLDALTQAVEARLSARANPVTNALARQAVALLMAGLPQAFRDGGDRAARGVVAEGSLLSAMAFSQSGLGAVHGLAHPLGMALDLPHGITCAILLPRILEWNAPVCQQQYADLAAAAGVAGPAAFVQAVRDLCDGLGIPAGFAGHGLREKHFPKILRECRSPSMQTNPRPFSDADILALLRQLAG